MPKFVAMDGGEVLLEMQAYSPDDVPTSFSGDDGSLVELAKEWAANGSTALQIASRCSPTSQLVDTSIKKPEDNPWMNPVRARIARLKNTVLEGGKVKKEEPNDEIDLQADGVLDDDDEGYDEETLRSLPLNALRAVAREFGIEPKGMGADTIVDSIMNTDDDEDTSRSPRWVTVFDLAAGVVTITAVGKWQDDGHWSYQLLVVDEARSDPAGEFVVYVGSDTGEALMVRIVLTEGEDFHLPPGLNSGLLGSPTLWPLSDRRFQYVCWSEGPLWLDS